MLADDFLHRTYRNLRRAEAEGVSLGRASPAEMRIQINASKEIMEDMQKAQRFVLSPQVVEAAWELSARAKAIENSRDYIHTPAVSTWIEWHGNAGAGWANSTRHGVFMRGDAGGKTELVIGQGMYAYDETPTREHVESIPFWYDFPGDRAIFQTALDHPLTRELSKSWGRFKERPGDRETDLPRMGRFIAAALALINTPRLTFRVPRDDHKINEARLKKGRPPLLSFSEVVIRPDSGWVSRSEVRAARSGLIARHHVRTFFRLRLGHVEVVKPHWRGNPERGYRLHRYVIKMDGEEAGAWKGEPMQSPRIIRPGEDLAYLEA